MNLGHVIGVHRIGVERGTREIGGPGLTRGRRPFVGRSVVGEVKVLRRRRAVHHLPGTFLQNLRSEEQSQSDEPGFEIGSLIWLSARRGSRAPRQEVHASLLDRSGSGAPTQAERNFVLIRVRIHHQHEVNLMEVA